MATPLANQIPLTGDPLKDRLIQGSAWTFSGARVLTYSFNINFDLDEQGTPMPGVGGNWTGSLSAAFVKALTAWSNVANVGFQAFPSGNYIFESQADIAAALTGNDLQNGFGAAGLGFFPDPGYATTVINGAGYTRDQYPRPEGDVLFDNFYAGYSYLGDGGFGLWAMLHELGHALGLKHPFDDGGNGRPFQPQNAWAYDNERYTVMSYSGRANVSGAGHAATPMPLDILAIQQIYGANNSYHTGNDNYTVALDGAMRTIWDAGGIDTLDAGALFGGVTLDLRPGMVTDLGGGGNSVLGIAYNCTIENAIGGAGSDALYGNSANNVLTGNGGTNTYYGGAGDDTYVVSSATDTIVENFGEGNDTVLASITFNVGGADVENLSLTGSANINATAGFQTLLVIGNGGANTLDGGNGSATMKGGGGNDTYVIRSGNTVAVELAGEGIDTVSLLAAIDYTLSANIENLALGVASGFQTVALTGNALANSIGGSTGAERLDGGAGADTLAGGGGADTYVVDDALDVIIESLDAAIDTVQSSVTRNLAAMIENLVLTGSAAIDGSGNDLDNAITGNDGPNRLAGGAGSDILTGADGADTLDGGAGFDWMRGGTGDDTYVVADSLPATAFVMAGDAGDYVTAGQRYGFTLANASFSVSAMSDATGDRLVDSVTLYVSTPGLADWWYLTFSTGRLGQNLAPGDYGGAQRASFAQPGHAGLDVFGNGRGNGSIAGSFSIQEVLFDYSGNAPVLVRFVASFEQFGEGSTMAAARGVIGINGSFGTMEQVTEQADGGNDSVLSTASYMLPANVENLVLTGGAATSGTGNALANALSGNAQDNVLAGMNGNDTLTGGLGDDNLDGGAGIDTAMFSALSRRYGVAGNPAAAIPATIAGPDGTDSLVGIEKIQYLDGTRTTMR